MSLAIPKPPFRLAFLHPKYALVWLALAILWVFTFFPVGIRRYVWQRLGVWSFNKSKRRRHSVETNLKLCFPDQSEEQRERMIEGHAKIAGFAIGEMTWLWFRSLKTIKKRTVIEGQEHIDSAKHMQRPLLFLVPHSLFLEYGGFGLVQDVQCAGIFNTFKNPLIDWVVLRKRLSLTPYVIRRQSGDTVQRLIELNQSGVALFHLMDEDYRAKKSVFAPFFGHQKATLANMADLLKQTNAIVLPMFPHYDQQTDKVIITIDAPVDIAKHCDDPVQVATQVNQAYESMIRRYPEQYMWNLHIFRTRPDGDDREFYI